MMKGKKFSRLFLVAFFFLGILFFSLVKVPCPFYSFTGYLCPGCGMTRAVFALLQGDFYQAFLWNPLVYLLLFFAAQFFFTGKIYLPKVVRVFLLVGVVMFGVLRNLSL